MPLSVSLSIEGDTTVIELTGELDAKTAPEFHQTIEKAAGHGTGTVEIRMAGVGYMASAGLRSLVPPARAVDRREDRAHSRDQFRQGRGGPAARDEQRLAGHEGKNGECAVQPFGGRGHLLLGHRRRLILHLLSDGANLLSYEICRLPNALPDALARCLHSMSGGVARDFQRDSPVVIHIGIVTHAP